LIIVLLVVTVGGLVYLNHRISRKSKQPLTIDYSKIVKMSDIQLQETEADKAAGTERQLNNH
jgi:hypothetical protein